MISLQHGMFAAFGNIGVVSETSLFIMLATSLLIQALRKAFWSVRGRTLRLMMCEMDNEEGQQDLLLQFVLEIVFFHCGGFVTLMNVQDVCGVLLHFAEKFCMRFFQIFILGIPTAPCFAIKLTWSRP